MRNHLFVKGQFAKCDNGPANVSQIRAGMALQVLNLIFHPFLEFHKKSFLWPKTVEGFAIHGPINGPNKRNSLSILQA